MQRVWLIISAAIVSAAAACRTPARTSETDAERLSGCFRRIYGDGPPLGGAGSVRYTLTTDAGATTLLEVSPAMLDSAGGPSRLDGARVSVVLAPARDSSTVRARTAQVRAIHRDPGSAGAPC